MLDKTTVSTKSDLVKIAKFLSIIWVALSLGDAVITYVCLQDVANIEGNPLARALLSQHEALFYGLKLLVTVGIGMGFWWLSTRTTHLKAMIVCQAFLVIMFAGVLGNNMLHL
jgi:hypothetical protein